MPHIVMDDGSVDERTVNHERVGLDSYLLGARASSWMLEGGQVDATNGFYKISSQAITRTTQMEIMLSSK